MKSKKSNLFRDCAWALGAFIRGKVLQDAKYRPHAGKFHLANHVNTRRITLLMVFWDYRPMTIEEMMEFVAYPHPMREQLWVDCSSDSMPASEGHGARVFVATGVRAA